MNFKAYRHAPPFVAASENNDPPYVGEVYCDGLFHVWAWGLGRAPERGEAFWEENLLLPKAVSKLVIDT